MNMISGWYQIAFLSELGAPIAKIEIASRRLMAVQCDGALRIFDASCPHRGADLAAGDLLEQRVVRCPFHGYRITLGESESEFCVREYPSVALGDALFAYFGADTQHDRGFRDRAHQLEQSCEIVPGFTMNARCGHELVVENAFDGAHFHTVHRVSNEPRIATAMGTSGELIGIGSLRLPASAWLDNGARHFDVEITARAYSPGIVVSDMHAPQPYSVITCATPSREGCVVRLSFGWPRSHDLPPLALQEYMIVQARSGLEQDRAIWEGLDENASEHLLESDAPIVAFREYCASFETQYV